MAMQRNKGVLEGNIFSKFRQLLVVRGMPSPILMVSRDAIPMEMGMIELADKRRVPGGRNNSGEFSGTIQLAHDETRASFHTWYNQCQDRGRGVHADYKRDGMLTYERLFEGQPGPQNAFTEYGGAGSAGGPFKLMLIGLWINRLEYPEFDMAGGDEGDSDALVTVNFNFDDVHPENYVGQRLVAGLTGDTVR